MTTKLRIFSLSAILALVLSACNLFAGNPDGANDPGLQATPLPTPTPNLGLIVTYERVDQTITFSYLVGNTDVNPIPGPITVTDNKVLVNCPEVSTVGNLDNNLDSNEAVTCTGIYTITQADIDAGSVTTLATATASGSSSATMTTTVPLLATRALTLTKTPDPLTFNNVGDTIIYSYVITNSGEATLGPAQFTVNDDKISVAINCGSGGTILEPNGTVSCSASYLITQADVTAGSVTNSASATDGTTTSNTVTATINRGTTTPPSNLTPGTTIQHQVVGGEWLWQIARCYGADPKQVVQSNSQLANPAEISPGITVTVPNIGAGGRPIYGPPCVGTHTVQSGETWNSIAQLHNADVLVLQEVNPGTLSPGRVLKVPVNSAGGL